MNTPEQQPTSNLQTLETELSLTRAEMEEFRKLPKEERKKYRDENLKKMESLQVKLEEMIQEAIKTGNLEEVKILKDQIEKELSELEVLLSPNKEKLTDIPFDPNNIFTEEDWKFLQNIVLTKNEPVSYSSLAIININKLPELSDVSIRKIQEEIDERGSLRMVAWAKYAQPKFAKIPDDILLKKEQKNMARYKERGDWRHFIEPVAWLTILGYRPELSEDDFKNIEKEFKSQKDGGYLIEIAAAISIIYPDYPLGFTPEQSKIMTDYIKKGTEEKSWSVEWYQFAAMAKIVADKLREIEANNELE